MREYVSSVSPKGQITIPAEIREMFKVKAKDKVVFEVSNGDVKIRPLGSPVDAIFQAVPALATPRSLEEMMEMAREEHAQEAATEGL